MQIKLASVKLARLYMKRVSTELEQVGSLNEPVREFLLLQGVRFAFRVHQVHHSQTLLLLIPQLLLKNIIDYTAQFMYSITTDSFFNTFVCPSFQMTSLLTVTINLKHSFFSHFLCSLLEVSTLRVCKHLNHYERARTGLVTLLTNTLKKKASSKRSQKSNNPS